MTIDYTVKILAPGKGKEIVARGRVVKPGNVVTIAAADVYAIAGPAQPETLCAVALVTFRNMRAAKA
jgi:acyl-coenzyme A thioesterase PaaI-like protein